MGILGAFWHERGLLGRGEGFGAAVLRGAASGKEKWVLDCVCRARAKVCGGLWHRAWAIGQRDASGGSCESLGGVKLGSRRAGARNVFVMLALVPMRDATNVNALWAVR